MPGAESATINYRITVACNSTNSASKPASKLTGERQLTSRAEVESVVLKFVEALNIDDASVVPLTKHVEYHGMFSPIPICGESDVREYIDQIAPFMLNETYGKMIVEGGSVAVMTSFDSVNGTHNEGAFFFEVEGDKINSIRAVFDTRRMFKGKDS
jgi:hypothetical protein